MENAISILSGGLDSAVSTGLARGRQAVRLALTFDYGQRAREWEIQAASMLCKKWEIEHKIIDLPFLSEAGSSTLTTGTVPPDISAEGLEDDAITKSSAKAVWVPNRNSVFINIAAAIAEAGGFQWIITGFNREEAETFPDNSPEFIRLVNDCLTKSTLTAPKVVSYTGEMDKTQILKTAIEMDIEIERLWCCYNGGEKWCGQCESCARLARAMTKLGVFERYADYFSEKSNRLYRTGAPVPLDSRNIRC